MGHNRNLADYAHHFDGTNIDLGSGNIETEGVVTYEDVTNVDSVGIITARAGVKVPDNQKVLLGTDSDLQIYHDGSHSYIDDAGTGNLYLRSGTLPIQNLAGSKTSAVFNSGGGQELYHNNSKKFETTTTGATVTGTLVSDGVTSELDLSAISASISDTAVHVFVYDTRKDSDGGAWRKRTQHTSWYNETLNTSIRGSRKEFPAVAVIVCLSGYIKIYDGDDPDLPLWMEIRGTTDRRDRGWLHSANITAASALNGIIALATYGNGVDSGGTHIVDFIKDDLRRHTSAGGRSGDGLTITQRGTSVNLNVATPLGLVLNDRQNDVAMTVLPNAPIDDTTGLPVPTIAVGTNAGISVIKDDGTVVNSASNTSYAIEEISIFSSGELYHRQGSGSNEGVCFNNPYTRISGINLGTYANSSTFWYAADGIGNSSNYLGYSSVSPNAITTPTHSSLNIGDNRGLTFVDVNKSSLNNGMVAYATTSYNTGYMHGDIKGAFLSDTDTTNVTASSAHYTETFTGSGDNTWGLAGGATMSGGVLTLANLQDSRATDLTAVSSLTTGQKYIAEIEIVTNTSQVFNLDDDGAGASVGGNTIYGSCSSGSIGKILIAFTKTASPRMRLIRISGGPATITSFKIYTAEEQDRSANNNGLKVFGTVTKSVVVATGAELVAYSNFSASNHLRQPPNSDMNIGTGDAYMMIWFKTTNASGTMMMMSYEGGVIGTNDYGKPFNIRYENGSVRGWASHNGFSTHDDVNHGLSTADGQWHCAAWVKRGPVFELYVDGEFIGSDTGSVGSNALSDANSELVIGARKRGKAPGDSEEPWNNGSLALARIGKSAPSAEQIKKMYEDEKILFQENAKATLYGSSDAVTALAHDGDTELLHVGTSAGRSDFQGLRRINNTTTAVTTAISASDDLIAEQ